MSRCSCEDSTDYRVTGEVQEIDPGRPRAPSRAVGTGEKTVRIRCGDCGGKVAYVGSDLLEVLGVPLDEIYNGRCLEEDQRVTLEVDLI